MPLKLVPPREGKSPNFTIRGAYLGVRVNKSSGAHKRSVALTVLRGLERAIECGEYPPKQVAAGDWERTFLTAAVAYMEAGRSPRHVAKLIKHFGATPLAEIDQAAIDEAAVTLFPHATAGTRNAARSMPSSAPRAPRGVSSPTGYATRMLPLSSRRPIASIPSSLFCCAYLLYTGLRLGEALALRWADVDLENARAWVRRQKDGIASDVRLRADLCERLGAAGVGESHERLFRFHQGGNLKHKLTRAKLIALGLPCPTRRTPGWQPPPSRLQWVNFHTFRHTWATWMRRAGTDVQGLVATGNWRDPRSAACYAHVVPREEWQRVDDLPSVEKTWKTS
jgi:integrase